MNDRQLAQEIFTILNGLYVRRHFRPDHPIVLDLVEKYNRIRRDYAFNGILKFEDGCNADGWKFTGNGFKVP